MKNIKTILKGGKEKPLKQYAVVKISTQRDENNEVIAASNLFCDEKHIFDDEALADIFCDHANKKESLSYQWRVIEFDLDI